MSGREYFLNYILDLYFNSDIVKLISEYDYHLDGYIINSYIGGKYYFPSLMDDGRFIVYNETSKLSEIYNTKIKTRNPESILPSVDNIVTKKFFILSNNIILVSHFGGKYLEVFYPNIHGNHTTHSKPDYVIERYGVFVSFIQEFPDNIYYMATSKGTIEMWTTLQQQTPTFIFDSPHDGHVTALTALKNNYLASGGTGSIKIWDLEKKICKFDLKNDDFKTKVENIYCIDENRLLAIYHDEDERRYFHSPSGIIIWNYQKGIKINSIDMIGSYFIDNLLYFSEKSNIKTYNIDTLEIKTIDRNSIGNSDILPNNKSIDNFAILPNGEFIYMTVENLLGILSPKKSMELIGLSAGRYTIMPLSDGKCLLYTKNIMYVIA